LKKDEMFPLEFTERIKNQSGIDAGNLIEALSSPAPVSIRVNSHKWHHDVATADSVPWEKDGYYLPSRPLFTMDPLYHAGVYYPQEASSMFAGEAFRQLTTGAEGLRVLDLSAAPGGKSTHISSLLGDGSYLVANEVIRARAAVLAENITKWGIGNVLVTQNDPSAFAPLKGFFDIIFVDAPCSGEGMFRDETARKEWSPANAQMCSERQRRIVMDVWPALKKGGYMVYSTCTFNPAENEENVYRLAETTGAESVTLDVSHFDGITTLRRGDVISYAFYPGKIRGDGFFLSVLQKKTEDESGFRLGKRQKIKVTPAGDVLSALLRGDSNVFIKDNRIISYACGLKDFEMLSASLNIIKAGTMPGELVHGKIIPSHDLAMSVRINREQWRLYEATWDEAVDFLRMADFTPQISEHGRVLVCYRDVPLGFVNNLGNRANNGYPQGWRIRMEKRDNFEDVL